MFGFSRKERAIVKVEDALQHYPMGSPGLEPIVEEARAARLNDPDLEAIRVRLFGHRTAEIRERVLATRRLSDEQVSEIEKWGNWFSINASFGENFTFARRLWQWENGADIDPTPVATSARLKKGETAYFSGPSSWAQTRTIRTRVSTRGFSVSIPIVKGLRYRANLFKPTAETAEELRVLAQGTLIVTNQRLAFVGDERSTSVALSRVLDIDAHKDAVEICKSSGKNDYFYLSPIEVEYVATLVDHFRGAV